MSNYEFAGTLYNNFDSMARATVITWLTANGLNDIEFVRGVITSTSAQDLSDELNETWDISQEVYEFALDYFEELHAMSLNELRVELD